MASYLWYGVDADQHQQQGLLQAQSVSHVCSLLAQQGIDLQRHFRITFWHRRPYSLPSKVACELLQQWRQLLTADIPLLDCVRLALPSQASTPLRWQLWLVYQGLQQGNQFTQLLAQQRLLPAYQVAILAAGEGQADLAGAMGQIIHQQQQIMSITQLIKRHLIMPGITLLAGIVVCILVLFLLIPNIVQLVANSGSSLPTATQWLLGTANWLQHYGLQLVSGIGTAIIVIGVLLSTVNGRRWGQQIMTLVPLWGSLYKLQNECLILQLLAGSLGSGVPILVALEHCQNAARDRTLAKQIANIHKLLTSGRLLSEACEQSGWRESQVAMLRLAEKTGDLESAFKFMSQQLESQLFDLINYITKLIEPLTTLFVATLVGGLVIAIYLPLMQMGSLL
jgi:type II secretory pathway component PulF